MLADIRLTDPELHGDRWKVLNLTEQLPLVVRAEIVARERAEAAERLAQRQAAPPLPRASELEARVAGLEQGLKELAPAFGPVIRQFVERETGRLLSRISALEEEVAELKARPALQYDGVWRVDRGYCPGAFVSDRGSGWVCVKTVEPGIRPGSSHECWRLVIKRGRDGRDAVPALA